MNWDATKNVQIISILVVMLRVIVYSEDGAASFTVNPASVERVRAACGHDVCESEANECTNRGSFCRNMCVRCSPILYLCGLVPRAHRNKGL